MQRNNCLVLNNSLHLYPSSLRRRAEPTLGSVRKGEKLSGMGRAGGSSRTPPLPTLPQVRSLSGFAMVRLVPSRSLSFSVCAAAWGDSSPGKGLFLSSLSFWGSCWPVPPGLSEWSYSQPAHQTFSHLLRAQRFSLCHPPALWNNTDPRTELCAPHQPLVPSPSPVGAHSSHPIPSQPPPWPHLPNLLDTLQRQIFILPVMKMEETGTKSSQRSHS